MPTFRIKRDDTIPFIAIQVVDASGTAYDLTGATAEFHMATTPGGSTTVNSAGSITVPGSGYVDYRWVSADTATAGLYFGEFQVTLTGGGIMTVPVDYSLKVDITTDLGD